MSRVHGTAVAVDGQAVLLRGPSGAGKSDLALRLIEAGAMLIADDQTEIVRDADLLYAEPPLETAGLIEIRNVGIRRLRHLARAPLTLLVDLESPDAIERLPEPKWEDLDGVRLPVISLAPFEVSAVAKLFAVMRREPVAGTVGMAEVSVPSTVLPVKSAGAAQVLLITGISGAGRSTTLKLLEDMGYEAVDNLPVPLLSRLTSVRDDRTQPIAVGIDVRTRDFSAEKLLAEVERLTLGGEVNCRLVFLECDDDILARRFTETRRRHPMAGDRPIMDGIRLERGLLMNLRERADLVIDTSLLRTADLKQVLAGNFELASSPGLRLFVTSFSFREGLPREADLVFDVRFLENPHYDPTLRPLTGLDPRIAAFVAADPSWEGFFNALTSLLRTLLPRYHREGKSYLTIAIGCTGGRHRSVFAAERLARWLAAEGGTVSVGHRDIDQPPGAVTAELDRTVRERDAAP